MKRNTWQRDAVRDALEQQSGFVSAQALHTTLVTQGTAIGLATVYRALADLASDGDADCLQPETARPCTAPAARTLTTTT